MLPGRLRRPLTFEHESVSARGWAERILFHLELLGSSPVRLPLGPKPGSMQDSDELVEQLHFLELTSRTAWSKGACKESALLWASEALRLPRYAAVLFQHFLTAGADDGNIPSQRENVTQ